MFDMKMKIVEQLELGYATENFSAKRKSKIVNRNSRATLWFARMRQIVDRAIDWPASQAAEQNTFTRALAAKPHAVQ